jgi:hypothetical protein
MFTGPQQKYYRPLVDKAWKAHAARNGIHLNSRFSKDQWYRCVLLDTVGIYTTKEADKTTDFDSLMLAFAEIAGDDYWIKRMAGALERRWKWLIAQKMSKMGKPFGTNEKVGEHYIGGIMKHMGLDQLPYHDLPAEHLRKIFIALDEQVFRHRHDRELSHADKA